MGWRTGLSRLLKKDRPLFSEDPFGALACLLPDSPVLVDGGAHEGTVAKKMLRACPGARVYAFEPTPASFEKLRAACANEPGIVPVHAALGSADGAAELVLNRGPRTNSLLARSAVSEREWPGFTEPVETATVEVVSLDSWAARSGVCRVDAIKLDLQGFEVEALLGASRLLREHVVGVYSEAQLTPLYEGAALFGDIDRALREHGFELWRIQELATDRAGDRTLYCDGLWVRAGLLASRGGG